MVVVRRDLVERLADRQVLIVELIYPRRFSIDNTGPCRMVGGPAARRRANERREPLRSETRRPTPRTRNQKGGTTSPTISTANIIYEHDEIPTTITTSSTRTGRSSRSDLAGRCDAVSVGIDIGSAGTQVIFS